MTEVKQEEKVCSKCRISKPLEEFSKGSKSRDGIKGNCKACDAQNFQDMKKKKKDLSTGLVPRNPPPPTAISEADRLALAHWSYVSDLLNRHGSFEDGELETIQFHYTTAFIHGYKHGLEMGV
jgi:hypothetical protein